MQEIIDHMNAHIPYDTPDQMQDCVDCLASITDTLLLKERFMMLSNFLEESKLPNFFPSTKAGILQYISQVPKITETITAQQMHFVCKLYEFFIQSPDQLSIVTDFAYKDLEPFNFQFFVYSVIPSIFGFFSCHEHLAYAYQFYMDVVMKLPSNVVEIVLKPFFLSSVTLYYVEAVYEDVNTYFCHDIQLAEKNLPAANIEIHAKTLSVSIINNLCLLPITHLNLLILLSHKGYTDCQIIEFLVKSVLIPQISMLLNASHFSNHINAFIKVAERSIEICKSNPSKNPVFYNIASIVDIPARSSDFEQHYIRYISTILDACILFASANKCIELPKILVKLGLSISDKSYIPIILKMYPKMLPAVTINKMTKNVVFEKPNLQAPEYLIPAFERVWRYIDINSMSQNLTVQNWCNQNPQVSSKFNKQFAKDLTGLCEECVTKITDGKQPCEKCQKILNDRPQISFADYLCAHEYNQVIKQSQDFEKMIQLKSSLNLLKKWISNVDRLYDKTVLSIEQKQIMKFVKSSGFKNATFSNFISQFGDVLNTPHASILFLATKYEMILENFYTNNVRNVVSRLKEQWRYHMDTSLTRIELPPCFSGVGVTKTKRLLINQYYMRISIGLESISLVPLHKRFLYIISMVDYVAKLEDVLKSGDMVLKHALKNCNNDDLIYSICMISATLGKSVDFIDALTSRERQVWLNLENIVIKLIDKDEELRKSYYQFQNEIFNHVKKYV
ncbi:hypothetical protein TVAG_088760 [Trichomonas vaginalis G3]|uniref:Uncharacterized protein n=1 Tax=Trichomonas vaginalis (strain ATCC PRA-98 / G3) TaxID=412133 RepID=A2EB21_TRIV3|nr:hypothetical protein TVAGG3_0397870 [Trichomonas vaginalis G3]EAY10161.1 hypothetical protein TVAG_088760 [Trichomonas vaginalis G3]KAI5534464.1 hypothetical protein TVAGG3_0397870 [Trichomonas vaginalis G3]|eukprot:XP_001322384.1 hypothetical protein [Trichomonas vaginalis G3]